MQSSRQLVSSNAEAIACMEKKTAMNDIRREELISLLEREKAFSVAKDSNITELQSRLTSVEAAGLVSEDRAGILQTKVGVLHIICYILD